jgi:hypothetical protein
MTEDIRRTHNSVVDHRDDAGLVDPLEFAVLQACSKDFEERLRTLEARLLGSDPPPSSDALDLSVSREKGIRVRGASGAVAAVLVALGVLLALAYVARYWGPPAGRWQGQTMGAGGK